jgi:hypothetical protein
MFENNRTIIGVFVVLLVVVAAAIAWWFFSRDAQEVVVEDVVAPTPLPEPTPTPSLEERLSEKLAGTTLKTSDAVVRELAAGLSSNPKLAAWLVNQDLIRRFTASVDRIASGVSPTSQVEFLRPQQGFAVKRQAGGVLVIDPESYQRYDTIAQVFASLDIDGSVALYRELKPLIDDAYAEFGPEGKSFDDRLDAAFDQLLAVPVLDQSPEVNQLVVTYAWADEDVEGLSGAQRHFLRMGPDNVSLIQAKLGEFRAALAASTQE